MNDVVTPDNGPKKGRIARTASFVYRVLRNYFAFVGLLVTCLPLLFAVALSKQVETKVDWPKPQPAALMLDLNGAIAERGPGFEELIFQRLFATYRGVYLPEIRAALKRAATDENVESVTVRFRQVQASPAEFADLRRILGDFRGSGKKVLAVIEDADDWNYYVASVADRILLNPASSMTLTGPSFHLTYFGDAIRKLGVDIDVVRAGKYKSAFEPFILNDPSEATLEQYRAMQTSLFDHVVGSVAEGRAKPAAEIVNWYKKSLFTADEAVAMGIVDALGYGPDKEFTVQEYGDTPAAGKEQISVTDQGGIALIEAVGEISMAQAAEIGGEDGITPGGMAKQLNWALDEDDVKAVVLRVSSPGGSATASDIIWEDVRRLAEKKPVVVSMGAYAASGGYYISAPATKIIAEPTTITGSIGVIGMLPSFSAFREKYGVSFHIVTSSDRASMLSGGSRATPEDKAMLDGTIASVYETFVTKVAEGRKLDVKDVHALAQGRVYTGLEAKELKLVDELGGLQAAFVAAKDLAGFDKDKLYPVLQYEGEGTNLAECLKNPVNMMKCLRDARGEVSLQRLLSIGTSPLTDDTARVASRVGRWIGKDGPTEPLALWPSYLSVSF